MSEKTSKEKYLFIYDDSDTVEEFSSISEAKGRLMELIEEGINLGTIKLFKGCIVGIPVVEFR